ncbi:nucleotide exchange factor GrpE [Schaalia suimastitidis]|uniref:nucleotide exchange factor GrpE n=1 Tax=Schaalia suimastitidis TaxID=121163 RepID=UPI0004067D09|nr:nucleotide exchange factor GrpE [Schaalia suimastitidis]
MSLDHADSSTDQPQDLNGAASTGGAAAPDAGAHGAFDETQVNPNSRESASSNTHSTACEDVDEATHDARGDYAQAAPEESAHAVSDEATQAEPSDGDIDMSAFEDQLGDSDLAAALEKIAELEDQVARTRASLYNLEQEYAGYVRRSKEAAGATRDSGKTDVLEALLPVLDDIHAAREAGDLEEGPFAAIATKLEDTLNVRFELTRFGSAGDDFDPQCHEALMANVNPEVDRPVIAQVLQPGYRRSDKVLRAVKVLVDNPE